MEPPNKRHFGANGFVPCREVVPISEGPLSEVPCVGQSAGIQKVILNCVVLSQGYDYGIGQMPHLESHGTFVNVQTLCYDVFQF